MKKLNSFASNMSSAMNSPIPTSLAGKFTKNKNKKAPYPIQQRGNAWH